MLINSVVEEFLAGPVGFAASAATLLSIAGATLLSALSLLKPVTIGKWTFKLATPALRIAAALSWAIAIPLAAGAVAGIAFTLNWIVGALTIPIALLVASTGSALVSGTLMQSWITVVATVRRTEAAQDEWFVGLTPLTEFTSIWVATITGCAVIAIAAGIAGPWLTLLGQVERGFPDQALALLAGLLSAIAFAATAGLLFPIVGQIAATVFTAQSGIRWAGAVNASQPVRPTPAPPPVSSVRTRSQGAARKRGAARTANPNQKDQGKA